MVKGCVRTNDFSGVLDFVYFFPMCLSVCVLCAALPLSQIKGGGNRDLRLSGHVGFDSFPDQLVTKCVNKGFDFNILCIGKATSTRTHTLSCTHQYLMLRLS